MFFRPIPFLSPFLFLFLAIFSPSCSWADEPDSQFYLDKANVYLKEGKVNDALNYLKEAVERNPYNVEARNNLGKIYAQRCLYDQAMEQFDKALAIQPNFVQALSNKSFVYLQRRAYPLCIQYAQKALLLDPSLGSAHYNLGLAFFAQKHYGDALVEIKKAVKAFPENSEVYERLGDVYQIQSRTEEALAYYRQSLEVNPLNTSARSKLGDAYAQEGHEKQAVEQYQAATDLNPSNISAHYQLAQHYEDIRDWSHAQHEYLMIIAYDDRQAVAHRQIAKIFERNDEMGLALYHWQKYASLNPDDTSVQKHIDDIRKPLLTKKQVEQMAAFQSELQEKQKMATPTPAPDKNNLWNGPKPIDNATPGSDAQAAVPAEGTEQSPASLPTEIPNGATQAVNPVSPSGNPQAVQVYDTPTPSVQLVPVDVVQPTPSDIATLPK